MLANRLKKLVSHGLLERCAYSQRPLRHEYRLTDKGRDLYPAIVLLMRWGDRWLADGQGPPVVLVHHECGKDSHPQLRCDVCNGLVSAHDMGWRPGPGAA